MFLFVALSVLAGFLRVPHDVRLIVSGGVSFLSLLALGWPVLRGIPWAQVRQDIGWTAGRNAFWESLVGAAAYAMSLPLLVLGLLTVVVLMAVQGLIAEGHTKLDDYDDVQPFPTGEYAAALMRTRRNAG